MFMAGAPGPHRKFEPRREAKITPNHAGAEPFFESLAYRQAFGSEAAQITGSGSCNWAWSLVAVISAQHVVLNQKLFNSGVVLRRLRLRSGFWTSATMRTG